MTEAQTAQRVPTMRTLSGAVFPCLLFLALVLSAPTAAVFSQECPPGWIPDADGECICQDDSYAGTVSCIQNNGSISAAIIRGTWIGNYSGRILAGISPYLLYNRSPQMTLPLDWDELEDENFICKPHNRHGVLCGQCLPGYSSAVNSPRFECVSCTQKDAFINWIKYLTLEYLPMTVFFALLLIFDVRITSGAANAFIFYAQMITTTFDILSDNVLSVDSVTHNSSRAFLLSYTVPYSIWNLNFFSILAPPFCLSRYIGVYATFFLRYINVFYPLLLIIVSLVILHLYNQGYRVFVCLLRPIDRCLAWVQRAGRFRLSAIHAFAVFLTLSYTKFVHNSLMILSNNSLYDEQGNEVVKSLCYYDGTVDFSTPKVIALFALTLVILFIFGMVFPIVLAVPSLLKFFHKVTRMDCFSRCIPWGRMQHFLQLFHACYKDGCSDKHRTDYRWFATFFLLLRILLFSLYSYMPSQSIQYTVQSIVCVLVVLLLAALRPFKKTRDNFLNIGVFCLLAINSVLMMYNYLDSLYDYASLMIFTFQYLITLTPLIIVCVYYSCRIFAKIAGRRKTFSLASRLRTSQPSLRNVAEDDVERNDLPDFLDFTEATGRLRDSNDDSSTSNKLLRASKEKRNLAPKYSNQYGSAINN